MKKQNVAGTMRYAIERHQMISDGDFVAVGVSGGKDSMALLHLMSGLMKYGGTKFRLSGITIDPGFEKVSGLSALNMGFAQKFCDSLDIELHIVKTDIAEIVFETRKETNPCALCANMRRGALATAMRKLGMNKLALGHHQDDLVNTFIMNLVYGGRIGTLEPLSYLERSGITVIRPLIYTSEKSVESYVRRFEIPVATSPCPVNKKTARERANDITKMLYSINEHSESAVINAVRSLIEK